MSMDKTITFRLEEKYIQELKRIAQANRRTRSEIIRFAVEEYVSTVSAPNEAAWNRGQVAVTRGEDER